MGSMRRLKLYLDTSVINHLFHDDVPERKFATEEFFRDGIAGGLYEAFASTILVDELSKTKDAARRRELLEVLAEYQIPLLAYDPADERIGRLANLYIVHGIIPAKKPEDAFHVAMATIFEFDVLVSWNFRHLANVNKEARIASVNVLEGFTKPLRLLTPLELSNS